MIKNLAVKEIFSTVQGEGFYSGSPAVFLRFAGCSVKCSWCDTDWKNGKTFTVENLISEVKEQLEKLPEQRLVITGGEPLDQRNLIEFIMHYNKHVKYPVSMETSASSDSWIVRNRLNRFLELAINHDPHLYITCSPKLSVRKSKIEDDFRVANLLSRNFNAELKVVIDSDEVFSNLVSLSSTISMKFKNYYIMFEDSYLQNTDDLQDKYLKFLSNSDVKWKISPRLHKQIKFS